MECAGVTGLAIGEDGMPQLRDDVRAMHGSEPLSTPIPTPVAVHPDANQPGWSLERVV